MSSKSLKQNPSNFLARGVLAAKANIENGYYDLKSGTLHRPISLKEAVVSCKKIPVIAEIKFYSPAMGALRESMDVAEIAKAMIKGGAVGISVLTDPTFFNGSLRYLECVRGVTDLPLLMKDFIIDQRQVDAGALIGADAVLLISSLYKKGLSSTSIHEMIDYAHRKGLEVLLEAHNIKEFQQALVTDADLVGINNRDLKTLKTDLSTTEDILRRQEAKTKTIISESGFKDAEQLRKFQKIGVSGFLVGSSIMKSENIEGQLKSLLGE